MWRWLAITAIALSVVWTFAGFGVAGIDALGADLFHFVIGFALAAILIVAALLFGPDAEPGRIDRVSSATLSAYLFAVACLVLASRHDPVALCTFVALVTMTIATSWHSKAAAAAVPAAALLAVLALGIGFALLFGATGYFAQGRSQQPMVPMLWSASAVITPIAILAALYYRIAEFAVSIPFSGAALLLAALFAVATEMLGKRQPHPGLAAAGALFAAGAIAALALSLAMAGQRRRARRLRRIPLRAVNRARAAGNSLMSDGDDHLRSCAPAAGASSVSGSDNCGRGPKPATLMRRVKSQ
jgi:uncharacterized membrane protein